MYSRYVRLQIYRMLNRSKPKPKHETNHSSKHKAKQKHTQMQPFKRSKRPFPVSTHNDAGTQSTTTTSKSTAA